MSHIPLLRLVLRILLLVPAAAMHGAEPAPLKVAFLYEHPVNAGGWSQSHERARQAAQAHFGSRIESAAFEGITPGPDTVRVLSKLAREGYGMIFATSFGHMNPLIKVARQFPRVTFEHASGYKQAANVGTYQIRAYEGRYLAGRIAGAMTRSNRLGYVAAFPIPEVVRGINAFTLGVRAVNPDATVQVIWINTWLDPSREREAAELLIGDGADVLTHHTETPAVMVAAEHAGVWALGYQFDRSAFAPTRHLLTIEHNWTPIYLEKIASRLSGAWQSTSLWPGVGQHASRLVGLSAAIPAAVLEDLAENRSALAAGSRAVFAGPLSDREGNTRVAAGEVLSDAEALKMEWLVHGVRDGS